MPGVSRIAKAQAYPTRPVRMIVGFGPGGAVTTMTRSDALPDIPAVSEFVTGYEASVWSALGAPRNTPTDIVSRLNRETNAALADPKIKARLSDLGATALIGSAGDFRKFIVEDSEKWGKVIRTANIKAE